VQPLSNAGIHTSTSSLHWVDHLSVPDLSCGTYSLAAGALDTQQPHTEDELYVCTGGHATLWTPTGTAPVAPGSVLFVPAGEEHSFVDIEEDLTVLVIFGPAEHSKKA
jgi:mannose-6-phosphate isomerase-like protein (cupin superfamily)